MMTVLEPLPARSDVSLRAGGRLRLPADLSAWSHPRSLIALVTQAVEEVDDNPCEGAASPDGGSAWDRRRMLALLTCGYAIGIYSSQEIEANARRGGRFDFFGGPCPDWNVIRRFRRRNRAAIQQCLEQVFEIVWESGIQNFPANRSAGNAGEFLLGADRSHPVSRAPIRAEAQDRINRAVQLDSIALDD